MKPSEVTNKQVLQLFWKYLRPFKWSFLVSLIFIVLWNAGDLGYPYFYKLLIDALTNENFTKEMAYSEALQAVFLILGLLGIIWISDRLHHYFRARAEMHVRKKLYNEMLKTTLRHSFNFFENKYIGSLISDMRKFESAFTVIMIDFLQYTLFGSGFLIISIGVVLFMTNYIFGLLLFGWLILYLTATYYTSLYKLKFDALRSEAESKQTGVLADIVTNYPNVKLFSSYLKEEKNFDTVSEEVRSRRFFSRVLTIKLDGLQGALMTIFEIVLLYLALQFWRAGTLTIGDLVLINGYSIAVFNRVWNFARSFRDVYEHFADAKEFAAIYYTPHGITDKKDAINLEVSKGGIKFERVTFKYNTKKALLSDFSLVIRPGEKIALVGHSGAGKSTIVKLLLRYYDVSKGAIKIDNTPITEVTQESLWHAIAYVPQDPVLFHRSVRENIMYGRPDATEKEMIIASKRAQCHEFITSFPEGYDTMVGERGVKLSGGERQRIAMARAMLKDAPILVLDEATSSLDSESERMIQEALHELVKGRTVIAIAHRLSTIMHMDRIIVVDKGKIVEQGTHKALVTKKTGIYQELWGTQVGGFIE